jgi:hypothetical protein
MKPPCLLGHAARIESLNCTDYTDETFRLTLLANVCVKETGLDTANFRTFTIVINPQQHGHVPQMRNQPE